MRKIIFGFLCFIFAIESINVIFMSNKLGISGTILMLIMTLGMSYYFYRLATKNNQKSINIQRNTTLKRTIYFILSIIFGIVTLASIIQFNDVSVADALVRLAIFAGLTCFCIYSAIETGNKIQEQQEPTVYKTEIQDLPPITDEQLEIEREKIKVNKLKRRFTFSDFAFMFLMLCIPIFGWAIIVYRVGRYLMKERYFMSKEFIQHKMQIDAFVKEYNDIARYVEKFQSISLQSNSSDKYKYAHLATGSNTSAYNIKRDRNTVNQSRYIHNASLQVVRNAELEPFKYLCKYFDFKPNEENLQYIQDLGEQVSRFLNAKRNLDSRYNRIIGSIRPPHFIMKHYQLEFLHLIEVHLPRISFKFPTYTFQYVSAGGNSSQTTSITLNEETIEMLIEYMDEQVKYKNSAKAQRSLMTKKLREYIKARDNYTCQCCSASTAQQDLLLLEVDHIIPVAKGGLSTEDNLQTLCWKCNRTKSDKILSV